MRRHTNQMETRAILPRVADLEHSVQWISLANDIDNLAKLGRPDGPARVIRRDKKRDTRIERHAYQRVSMPEMQRACTVRFEDDDDDHLEPLNSRWSWKPRTDFEREYFYKDYKDYYRGNPGRCLEPVSRESNSRDRIGNRMEDTRRRFSGSPAARDGLEKEHFSDSRERLHEIFEHNRYLRRQFFADMPGNARHVVERSSQEAPRRGTGFGSTETLTSQSNQSSVSSINERKSRAQLTRTPEEEETDTLTEFSRNLSRVVNRRNGRARRDGRVRINILPGSEIRRADVRNVSSSVKLDEASNERSEEAQFRDATSDKSCQCHIERNLPEYIFGDAAKSRWDSVSANIGGETNESRTCWDFCRSLPNLEILKRNPDTPLYVARAVNVPEGLESFGHESRVVRTCRVGPERCRERRLERCEEIVDRIRSNDRGQFKSPTDVSVSRREVKVARIPPPLDLSMVNERCERMEASENKCLDDYSVDVAILRNHEDSVLGSIERDNVLARIISESSRNDQPRGQRSSGPPRKSCDDLFSLSNKLRSPQLVNNCESSTSDLRGADPASIGILPIDPDAHRHDRATSSSPLFDQTSPIGGLHAAGSALPSTVYGPIPYSQ